MATLVIPNTVQIVAEATCSGQQVINVLHFTGVGGVLPAPNAALASFKTAWEKTGGPLKLKSNGMAMVGYKLTDLSTAAGAVAYLPSNVTGGVAGALATMASAGLVKMGGGTRSRSSAGRIYHGPLQETQINPDGRTIDPTFMATLTLAYQALLSDMAAAGLMLAVASRKHSTAFNVSSVSVATIIATQRRRLR